MALTRRHAESGHVLSGHWRKAQSRTTDATRVGKGQIPTMGDDGPSRPTPTGGGRGRPTGPTGDWQTASRGRALLQRSKTLQATCDPCRDAAQALAPTADETSQHGTEHGDRKTTTREHGRDWTKMQGTQRRRIALFYSPQNPSSEVLQRPRRCWLQLAVFLLTPYSLLPLHYVYV